jgi:hypothetical protein
MLYDFAVQADSADRGLGEKCSPAKRGTNLSCLFVPVKAGGPEISA